MNYYSRIYLILTTMDLHINERKDKTTVSRNASTTLFINSDLTSSLCS